MSRLPAFTPKNSHRLTLRPFVEAELSQVWVALQQRTSGHGKLGRRAQKQLRHRIRRSGQFSRGMLDLAIEAQGRLILDIQARQPPHAMPSGVFELGIEINNRADHGKGYGSEAVGLITGWLFDQAGAERVQAGTALGNASTRTVLERLGFGCPLRSDEARMGSPAREIAPAVLTESVDGVLSGRAASPGLGSGNRSMASVGGELGWPPALTPALSSGRFQGVSRERKVGTVACPSSVAWIQHRPHAP